MDTKKLFEVPVWIEVEADDSDTAWEDTVRLMAGLELYKTHRYTVMEPTKVTKED